MRNFYPHGHVMPGGDGSGERHPTQQVAVPRTAAEDLSAVPRTYSLVKFNSYRKRGKAGSPPATTSNPYAVLKKVDWLAVFSPWYFINKAKYYTTLLLPTIFVSIFICFSGAAQAQSPIQNDGDGTVAGVGEAIPLRVGNRIPDDFWTREHLFYINGDTVRKTLEEHKGKYLVLDFWMTGCTKCLLHQKEINYFRDKYADDLAVIMVNSKQSKEDFVKIDSYLNSDRFKRLGLDNFSSIIEDDYLQQLFIHYGYPSYFWINPRGIVQLHTFRNLLDRNYQAPFTDYR